MMNSHDSTSWLEQVHLNPPLPPVELTKLGLTESESRLTTVIWKPEKLKWLFQQSYIINILNIWLLLLVYWSGYHVKNVLSQNIIIENHFRVTSLEAHLRDALLPFTPQNVSWAFPVLTFPQGSVDPVHRDREFLPSHNLQYDKKLYSSDESHKNSWSLLRFVGGISRVILLWQQYFEGRRTSLFKYPVHRPPIGLLLSSGIGYRVAGPAHIG